MNKRDVVLSLTDPEAPTPYIPAAFFLHFGNENHHGQAAIDKHLEFFNYTGMDFVKIQYELSFPPYPTINKPEDWRRLPLYDEDFFYDQWQIARGLVESAGSDALVIMTLYSPFMCAGQITDKETRNRHIKDYPEHVLKGLEIITESLMGFVDGCIQQGIDGFYHSTQGGEANCFGGSPLFQECIKPFDLTLMNHIQDSSRFNILHICDYHGSYDDYSPFLDYPGDIVNCPLNISNKPISSKEVSLMFSRPFMGGLDRNGIIVSGNEVEIMEEVEKTINNAPDTFLLGADCTLPGDINWDNIRTAIDYSHQARKLL